MSSTQGVFRHFNRVVLIGVAVPPAVQNDQCGFHAANVGDDSTPLRPNRTHRKAALGPLFHFQLGPMCPHGFCHQVQAQPRALTFLCEPGQTEPGLFSVCRGDALAFITTSTEARYPSHCHATCTLPVECFKAFSIKLATANPHSSRSPST